MKKKPRRKLQGIHGDRGCAGGQEVEEWVGALRKFPEFLFDHDPPWLPLLALWMALPSGRVIGHDLVNPNEADGALGAVLRETLRRNGVDPVRIGRFRIESEESAPEVREVVGENAEITVAPTPEIDEVLTPSAENTSDDPRQESYLEGGNISARTVRHLFDVAVLFHAMTPWKTVAAEQVLRMDLPELEVEGACVSIIGGSGGVPGFLLFPSLDGFHSWASTPEPSGPEQTVETGTTWLSFELEQKDSLSKTMQKEIARFGWRPLSGDLCPRVRSFDHDATIKPLTARELEIVWRCAIGVSVFITRNSSVFREQYFQRVSESSHGEDRILVQFTYPYDAYDGFEETPEGAPAEFDPYENVGRNDPCPCGSGREFKKCHMREHEERMSRLSKAAFGHQLDAEVLYGLLEEADRAGSDPWLKARSRLKAVAPDAAHLVHSWLVYSATFDGKTLAETGSEQFGTEEREWLAAQRAAWFSVWEVLEVEPGVGLQVRDLITGIEKRVVEREGSTCLVGRGAVLGRVVDYRGLSLMCSVHPRPLPPRDAAEVVERARKRLRRRSPPPPDRLRDSDFSRYLIRSWHRQVQAVDARRRRPLDLHNRDGDPILFTTDHFDITAGGRPTVVERLASIPGVDPPRESDEEAGWTFLRPVGEGLPAGMEGQTIVGKAFIYGKRLSLESNSVARADDLRTRVERACGDLLLHVLRVHEDPRARIT